MKALAPVIPERAMAAFAGLQHGSYGGVNPRTGRQSICFKLIIGGTGARAGKDGLNFMAGPTNPKNLPIEVLESEFPLRINSLSIVPDTGGAGKYRGSVALCEVSTFFYEKGKFSNLTMKDRIAPFGLFGGKCGVKAKSILYREGREEILAGRGDFDLRYGDTLSLTTAGSGGIGDPLERDIEAVVADVMDGYVTIEGARRDYGVKIDKEKLMVNYEETEKLRARRKKSKIKS